MPSAEFRVTISAMRATELPAMDVGGTSDPFIKINFDNFKEAQTSVKARDCNPEWPDTISFPYSTKYSDCLSRKYLTFSIFDHNRFSANAVIGSAKVDLHSIATGPEEHKLLIRDGRRPRGTLFVKIVMEQIAEVECKLSRVILDGKNAGNVADAQLTCTIPACKATATIGAQIIKSAIYPSSSSLLAGTGGSIGWTSTEVFKIAGTVRQIMSASLSFSFSGSKGTSVLATGSIPLQDARSFVDGAPAEFSVDLAPTGQGSAMGLDADLAIIGSATFTGMPSFAHMTGGIHDGEKGILGSTFLYPDIPFLPRVPVFDAQGNEVRDIKSLVRQSSARVRRATGGGGGRGAASAGIDLTTPQFPPGSGKTPPALTDRLFGGAQGLPVCWIRRGDEATGQVAFENLCTGLMEATLPVEGEYVVTVPVNATGALGLQLEPNFSGTQRFGFRSGRRNSGYDLGAVVRACKPESVLGKSNKLRAGHHLIAINGATTAKMTFADTVDALKAAGRPLVLRFHDPYAVPGALAAQASKASLTDKQALGAHMVLGGRRVNFLDAARSQNRGGGGGVTAVIPQGPPPSKKTQAQAQATLDLALNMLGRMNIQKNDVLVASARAAGRSDDQAIAVQRALVDAGFLRTLAVAVSGVATDVAPAKVREKLEAEAKAAAEAKKREAGDEEEKKSENEAADDDRDFSEDAANQPAPKMHTSDTTAAAAMTAIGALANASKGKPSDNPAIRAIVEERTKRMADAGVFQRSIAAVQQRAQGFAETALGTIASIAKGNKTAELGLTEQSLIIVQQAQRKHEYRPGMAEEVGGLVRSLASENKEQDGMGFIKLVIECTEGVAALSAKGYFRAKAPDGNIFYMVPGGQTAWEEPAEVKTVMSKLILLDRVARLMEDAAVVNATTINASINGIATPILSAIPAAVEAQHEDPFVVCVLLSAAAKLAAVPANAGGLVIGGHILGVVESILTSHASDLRLCEVVTSLFFNVGRDLDYSEHLLLAGAVGKVTALARAYLHHKATWTGTTCSWPPAGREDEVGEAIILPGTDRMSRDKNTMRPRLIRICINVLINLACYRRATPSGATSVDLIVSNRGVELLGETLLAHISDASVVTSVLNCAANIAFKNREVQLAIGASMTDAIILSGWSFLRDANLLSMALRAIGNLTNEDSNIYCGLGFGVSRMIAAAMKANGSDTALQTLAASVLSNIASVEPADAAAAQEDVAVFQDAFTARSSHPAAALKPTPGESGFITNLFNEGKCMWQIAPWLLVEENAVGALVTAMTKYSTDVTLVEACLRTLLCVAGEEDVTAALIARHDLVNKVLFVMRAADFNVSVQTSGTAILQVCAAISATQAAVVSSDAALTMLAALDNHKGSLSTAVNAAIAAVSNATGDGNLPQVMVKAVDQALDGKAHAVLILATKVCDTVSLLTSARASKAAIELGSPQTTSLLLQSILTLMNTLARRGFSFIAPQAGSRVLADLIAFAEAASLLIGDWVRHPSAKASSLVGPDGNVMVVPEEEAACYAVRNMLTGGGRNHSVFVRTSELCVTGTGEPGSPATLAVTPRVARAVLGIPAALMIRGSCLHDRASPSHVVGTVYAPYVEVDGMGIEGIATSGGLNTIGALLLALVGAIVHYVAQAQNQLVSRGTVAFDTAAVTARAAAMQGMILLDILGSVAAPPQSSSTTIMDESGNTTTVVVQPPPGSDAASTCAALVDASVHALQASAASCTAFLPKDLTPTPLRMSEIVDLASRIATQLNSRAHAIMMGDATPHPPVPNLSEARSIFTFSVSRAKAQASVTAVEGPRGAASNAMPSVPGTYGARSGPGSGPSGGAATATANSNNAAPSVTAGSYGAPASNAAAVPGAKGAIPPTAAGGGGGGGSHDAGSVNLHHGHGAKTLRRSLSSRSGFVGALVSGMAATAWIEGKPHSMILKVDEECKDLHLFEYVSKKKGSLPSTDGMEPLAIVPGGAFVAVRIGKALKDGKSVKQGGLFSKGPKSDRTVCLDSAAGNSIVQLEMDTVPLANELCQALEGLSTVASRLASGK